MRDYRALVASDLTPGATPTVVEVDRATLLAGADADAFVVAVEVD
jgi:hypothetical protein